MKSVRDVQPTWFGRSVGCWPTLPIKCESMTADGLFPLPRTGPILNMMTSSRLRQRCRIIPLLFTSYGLAWSTTCGSVSSLQVGVSQPKLKYHPPTFGYSHRKWRGRFLATVEWFPTLLHWLRPQFVYRATQWLHLGAFECTEALQSSQGEVIGHSYPLFMLTCGRIHAPYFTTGTPFCLLSGSLNLTRNTTQEEFGSNCKRAAVKIAFINLTLSYTVTASIALFKQWVVIIG